MDEHIRTGANVALLWFIGAFAGMLGVGFAVVGRRRWQQVARSLAVWKAHMVTEDA